MTRLASPFGLDDKPDDYYKWKSELILEDKALGVHPVKRSSSDLGLLYSMYIDSLDHKTNKAPS